MASSMTCANCGADLVVFVEAHHTEPSANFDHTTYFKCEHCAQVQIVDYHRVQATYKHLDEILATTMAELGASMGNIQLLNRRSQTLFIAVQRGFDQDFLDHFRRVSVRDDCACGIALRQQKRILVEDIETEDFFASMRPIARAAGFRAVQSTPLIHRHNGLVGMLSTHFSHVHRPTEHEFNRLALHAERAVEFI